MSWYDANRRHRLPISVPGGATGARDAQLTIPPSLRHFWSKVKSDHYDVVITAADGKTLMPFEFSTWTYASSVGVIDVDDVDARSGECALLWLYYGYPGASASLETSFVFAAADTAYLAEEAPTSRLYSLAPDRPGLTAPSRALAKMAGETVYLYWDAAGQLSQRSRPAYSSLGLEMPEHGSLTVYASAAAQAGMIDATETRWIADPRRPAGAPLLRTLLKAGADNTDYTVEAEVRTSLGSILTSRLLLQVRDPDEV